MLPREKKLLLKAPFKLVWLTWDESATSHPFNFCGALTSENVWTALALSDDFRGEELLIFHFEIKDKSFEIFRPTWCDADFFDKFRPTESDPKKRKDYEVRWGQTMPVRPYALNHGYKHRRPEGVVKADTLTLSSLTHKIQQLPL